MHELNQKERANDVFFLLAPFTLRNKKNRWRLTLEKVNKRIGETQIVQRVILGEKKLIACVDSCSAALGQGQGQLIEE